MEKSHKRGKIPQQDWPSIMARYDSGETLASIARTYDCSPPAISYIVSRSRTRNSAAESPQLPPPPAAGEPQLVKTHAADVPAEQVTAGSPNRIPPNDSVLRDIVITSAAPGEGGDRREPLPVTDSRFAPRGRDDNGAGLRNDAAVPDRHAAFSHAAPSRFPVGTPVGPAADARRPLHPSFANNAPQAPAAAPAERQPRFEPGLQPGPQRGPNGPARAPVAAYGRPAELPAEDDRGRAGPGNGGSFIDQALRARVDNDIAAFLAAFDAALAGDSQESRAGLREATDRLLRVGARTRIELERLEARMPLTPREPIGRPEPAWRHR
jgi:hypothetical protein